MSLIISVYVPTGIVISGDSRTTIKLRQESNSDNKSKESETSVVLSDASTKVSLLFCRFGVGAFGSAIINDLPVAHHLEQFEIKHADSPSKTTDQLGKDLLTYFRKITPIPSVNFVVAGYDGHTPWVLSIDVADNSSKRVNIDQANGEVSYGILRGGNTEVVDRLLCDPKSNPLFRVMNLQDAVDYSRHLIRSTIDQLRFEPRFPTVGGPIDTLIVTPSEVKFLVNKDVHC